MKKTALFTIVFLAIQLTLLPCGQAQTMEVKPQPGPQVIKKASDQTGWMTYYLKLDKETAQIVDQINLKHMIVSDSIRTNNIAMVDKRPEHEAILQNRLADLQSVLSPEQYKKLVALYENSKKKENKLPGSTP